MPSNPYPASDPLAKRWNELMAQGNEEAAAELAYFNPPEYPDPADLGGDDDDRYFYADEPDSEFDEELAAEDEKHSDVAAGAELDWRKL